MISDKRILVAGVAIVLAASSTYGFAQTPDPASRQPVDRQTVGASGAAETNFARDRNVSVQQRPHEGYQARGLRAGAFMIFPKVSVDAERNDNIYARDTGEQDDTIFRVRPELNVNSNWSRHSLSAYARGTLNRYQDFSTEDTDDFAVGGNGRIDIVRGSNITANVGFSHNTEPRTSPNSPGVAAKPVRYDLTEAQIRAQHEFNRLRLSGWLGSQRFDYESPPRIGGGRVEQAYREREVRTYAARADYAISPDAAFFVEVEGNKRDYRHNIAGDVRRDSDGVQALTGANFEIGAVTRGEIGVGYLKQNFDDARLKDISGFGARAKVEWFPTELTTITLNAGRTVTDSATPGEGAYIANDFGFVVDHELLRNVILSGYAKLGRDKYDAINRKDERTGAGFSATYMLNRSLSLKGSYDYSKQETVRGSGSNFTVNKIAATLTAQF